MPPDVGDDTDFACPRDLGWKDSECDSFSIPTCYLIRARIAAMLLGALFRSIQSER
jgi:hypothetical protein